MPKFKIPKLTDSALSSALIAYFAWPFWVKHGGPPPPTDLGTVVLAIIGLYGTSKAFNTTKEQAEEKAKKESKDEDPRPAP